MNTVGGPGDEPVPAVAGDRYPSAPQGDRRRCNAGMLEVAFLGKSSSPLSVSEVACTDVRSRLHDSPSGRPMATESGTPTRTPQVSSRVLPWSSR